MPTMFEFICTNCAQEFSREKRQVSSSIAKNVKNYFCGRSCSVTYQNKTVGHGEHRSAIEYWLESRIKEKYPQIEVLFGDKKTIGSELDIYIPSINTAIELQGRQHYEPIWGQDILDQTQKNDVEKRNACAKAGIKLIEVDMSKMTAMKRDPEFLRICEEVYGVFDSIV
jgi:hypothetical protein